jgi:hypothetical protein
MAKVSTTSTMYLTSRKKRFAAANAIARPLTSSTSTVSIAGAQTKA